MTEKTEPRRGEVWEVRLDPVEGHEQGGTRPALVLSVNAFNAGRADLVVVAPISTRDQQVLWHVPAAPPEGGLKRVSYVKCEDLRAVSKSRLKRRWGTVSGDTMGAVSDRLRVLLDL